jgi:hypothetical protein
MTLVFIELFKSFNALIYSISPLIPSVAGIFLIADIAFTLELDLALCRTTSTGLWSHHALRKLALALTRLQYRLLSWVPSLEMIRDLHIKYDGRVEKRETYKVCIR